MVILKRTVGLIILDGFGIREESDGNAVRGAKTPNLDRLFAENPYTEISASGLDVGLPEGQMGNSEVGHLNIGAGRVVYQELTRITKAIEDGDFFENAALQSAMYRVKERRSKLHLMGLFSDGGVHSHIDHLKGLLEMAKRNGVEEVYVHAFTDGRDTSPKSGIDFCRRFEREAERIGVGKIATISGRYYAMDRDHRWDRVEKAYSVMTQGSKILHSSPCRIFEESYASGVTDEFIVPAAVSGDGVHPIATVEDGDAVIFYNFRPDRAREMTRAFVDADFEGFERTRLSVHFVCMTQYDETISGVEIAYRPQFPKNTLGEYAASLGMRQLRIAETEKYAHVTFFFGGGVETPYANEDRILVHSPKVATYDLQPEMSAREVADRLIAEIERDYYDIIICNFANPDMVGHTGVYDAAVKAVETVDECVGRVAAAFDRVGAGYLITADHGNCEYMTNPDGTPMTAHTTNPVPLVIAGCGDLNLRSGGKLSDLSPTILELMGVRQPEEMTGCSLIQKPNRPILSCGIECPAR